MFPQPRLILPPGNYSRHRWPNQQAWSFRKRTLYKSRNKRKKLIYWIKVQMPDRTTRNYQLPKDVQFAITFHHKLPEQQQIANDTLIDALINVPVSRYDKSGHVNLQSAKILKVYRHKSTGHPDQITRSQFIKPSYNKFGLLKLKKIYTYLRHDVSTKNRWAIFFSIVKLVPLIQPKRAPKK